MKGEERERDSRGSIGGGGGYKEEKEWRVGSYEGRGGELLPCSQIQFTCSNIIGLILMCILRSFSASMCIYIQACIISQQYVAAKCFSHPIDTVRWLTLVGECRLVVQMHRSVHQQWPKGKGILLMLEHAMLLL